MSRQQRAKLACMSAALTQQTRCKESLASKRPLQGGGLLWHRQAGLDGSYGKAG